MIITKNNEVIFNTEDVFVLDDQLLSYLIGCARSNERKTVRICIHKSLDEQLHQMIIVHHKGNYIRPHRHPSKTESFHLIQGSMLLCIFDDRGKLIDSIILGENRGKHTFVSRIEKNIYHTVVPLTDVVVFHEITNGPFTGIGDSEFPEWAPEQNDQEGISDFLNSIGIAY